MREAEEDMPAKKQASPEDAPERRPARTNGLYLKTAFPAVTAVCAAIKKRYMTHTDTSLRTSKKEPPEGLDVHPRGTQRRF